MNLHEMNTLVLREIEQVFTAMSEEQFEEAVDTLNAASRIFVCGSGRSGLEASGLAMRLMHLGKMVFRTGEVTCPPIAQGDLLVAVSGSGKTASVMNMVKTAKSVNAALMVITTDPDSEMARMADHVLVIPAKSAKNQASDAVSFQPLSNLFVQALCLCDDYLILSLMEKMNLTEAEMKKNHTNLE